MNIAHVLGARQFGVAAAAALAIGGVAAAMPAGAAQAAVPSASVANDTLTIRGTAGDDAIQLAVATGDPTAVQIDFGNGTLPQKFDRSTFTNISASLGRGDDSFTVNAGSGSLADKALTVDGGSGNDMIVGGDGNDTLSGGSGNDNIQGGDGNDLIFGNGGKDVVDGNRGNDTEILGSGQDSAVWNPGEGSDVINGGPDADTLVFNGSNAAETMSLSANGNRAVFLRDVAAIRMDMDNVEQLDLATLGGADSVTVNDMTGTDIRGTNIDLSSQGAGDAAADVVTVNGTNKADRVSVSADGSTVDAHGLRADTRITGSEPALDRLQVNSLGGNDSVDVSDAARALIGVAVDLGTGQR